MWERGFIGWILNYVTESNEELTPTLQGGWGPVCLWGPQSSHSLSFRAIPLNRLSSQRFAISGFPFNISYAPLRDKLAQSVLVSILGLINYGHQGRVKQQKFGSQKSLLWWAWAVLWDVNIISVCCLSINILLLYNKPGELRKHSLKMEETHHSLVH